MYIPPKFKVDDVAVIDSFIRENPFGLLLSLNEGEIHDTHTPFIISEQGFLLGHIAKANPQWKSWANESRVKVIFSGPHAYISPRYYASDFNVPTWNYTSISIAGRITIIEDQARMVEFLDALVAANENSDASWKMNHEDDRYMKLLSGIVVFSVSMDQVEASFKLNQNKSYEDQKSVVDALSQSGCPFDHQVSNLMNQHIKKTNQ